MLLDRLAAAEHVQPSDIHAGSVAAGRVADCGLATAIGIAGACGSRPNNSRTCFFINSFKHNDAPCTK